jgi:hypothetical protein
MEQKAERHPECFGDLQIVFPLGDDGLRHSPRRCLHCVYKTECLRSAVEAGEGAQVREEMVDRAYESGLMGFFQRWSRKKQFHQRRQAAERAARQGEIS